MLMCSKFQTRLGLHNSIGHIQSSRLAELVLLRFRMLDESVSSVKSVVTRIGRHFLMPEGDVIV